MRLAIAKLVLFSALCALVIGCGPQKQSEVKNRRDSVEQHDTESDLLSEDDNTEKGEEVSDSMTADNTMAPDDIQNLYEKFINDAKYLDSSDEWMSTPSDYTIFDINNDSIPELLIIGYDDMGFCDCVVYTFDLNKSEVVHAGVLYGYGGVSYSNKYSAIISTYPRPDYFSGEDWGYMLSENKLTNKLHIGCYLNEEDTENESYYYKEFYKDGGISDEDYDNFFNSGNDLTQKEYESIINGLIPFDFSPLPSINSSSDATGDSTNATDTIEISQYLDKPEQLIKVLNVDPVTFSGDGKKYTKDGFELTTLEGYYGFKNESSSNVKLFGTSLGDPVETLDSALKANGIVSDISTEEYCYFDVGDNTFFLSVNLDSQKKITGWYVNDYPEGW